MSSRPAYFVDPWDLNRSLACVPDRPGDGTVVLVDSVVFVFSAMRHFADGLRADELRVDGFEVELVNAPTGVDGVARHVRQHRSSKVVALQPREMGLTRALEEA